MPTAQFFFINTHSTDFVRIFASFSDSPITFLLDTQAEISLIKTSAISDRNLIDKSTRISLKGITNEVISSLGLLAAELDFNNHLVQHDFHVVSSNFPIPAQGIIGMDYFKAHNCVINYSKMEFTMYLPERVIIPIVSKSKQGQTIIPPRAECYREFQINQTDTEVFVESQELAAGVYCARTIVHSANPVLKIINTTNNHVAIPTNVLKYENLNNYTIFTIDSITKSDKRLEALLNIVSKNVPDHCKEEVLDLIIEFHDIFSLKNDQMTVNNFYQQALKTIEAKPSYIKNYRTPFSQKAEIDSQVHNLIKNDLIEPSCSQYNSPLLLVPKKAINGSPKWRLCVDYRAVNKQLISDTHPLPRIEDILDSLGRAKYFTVLDLFSGFHQVPLEEDSRDITSFSTSNAAYRWKVLPFGLKVSPNSFSRMMSMAFAGATEAQHFLYIDDIIVVGRSIEHHLKNLRAIFQKCRDRNLKLNPEKCVFFKPEVTYLGHICSEQGILPDSQKLRAMELYPRPTDKDAVKRFVAFANYYRKFLYHFASVSQCLNNLTRKSVQFAWTPEHEESFQTIKKALMSPPILAYPDFEKEFVLFVDASNIAVGSVLAQKSENEQYLPIAFASKCFSKSEQNKSTIEKELLAIHFAIKHFKPYVYGVHFTVKSDHKPLSYLFALKDPSSRLTRIRLDLEEFDFTVEYIKGKDNVLADALSRITIQELKNMHGTEKAILPVTTRAAARKANNQTNVASRQTPVETEIYIPTIYEPISSCQVKNLPILKFQIEHENDGNEITISCKITKSRKTILSQLISATAEQVLELALARLDEEAGRGEYNPLLCKMYINDDIFEIIAIDKFKEMAHKRLQNIKIALIKDAIPIASSSQKMDILRQFHDHPVQGAHAGKKRLHAKIKAHYSWHNMSKDISQYVDNCRQCQTNKAANRSKEPMCLTSTPAKPFDTIIVDTVGPLPITEQNNKYLLTIMCDHSKFLICVPMQNKEARTVAKAIAKNVVLTYGLFKNIRTDQGTEYRNELITEIMQLLGAKHDISTPYHHESVGTIERNHRVLNEYLRSYLVQNREWDELSTFFTYSYNCTPHTSFQFKFSPFELIFGKTPSELNHIYTEKIDPIYNFDNYAKQLKYNLQTAHKMAQDLLQKAKEIAKIQYDRKEISNTINIRDLVLVKSESKNKLDALYIGPFEVTEVTEFNITFKYKNSLKTVHKNRVKKYNFSSNQLYL